MNRGTIKKYIVPIILVLFIIGASATYATVKIVEGHTGTAHAQGPTPVATLPSVVQNPVPINEVTTGIKVRAANCGLFVPANPFSDIGLATPWQLISGLIPCNEADAANAVFLQATVFDPASKQFFVYPPLVIDQGTLPAIAPAIPQLPPGAVVGIWGGSNGGAVQLVGDGAGECSNGAPGPFGQVFFCGAAAFFAAVNASGITLPPPGTANDGMPCPTVRDFAVVDQDQSDNVQTEYLVDATGRTAQDTSTNTVALDQTGVLVAKNPSDNRVLTNFIDKALGCIPLEAPDIANGGVLAPSQALDELQAAEYQAPPQAYVPAGDPMVLGPEGEPNLGKVNQYRLGADQPLATTLADASTAVYCVNILNAAPARLLLDKPVFLATPSPVPAQGDTLYTFLASRLSVTLDHNGGLNCLGLLDVTNPVHLILDGNGTAIEATIYGK